MQRGSLEERVDPPRCGCAHAPGFDIFFMPYVGRGKCQATALWENQTGDSGRRTGMSAGRPCTGGRSSSPALIMLSANTTSDLDASFVVVDSDNKPTLQHRLSPVRDVVLSPLTTNSHRLSPTPQQPQATNLAPPPRMPTTGPAPLNRAGDIS
jgi:hypothetical protein